MVTYNGYVYRAHAKRHVTMFGNVVFKCVIERAAMPPDDSLPETFYVPDHNAFNRYRYLGRYKTLTRAVEVGDSFLTMLRQAEHARQINAGLLP